LKHKYRECLTELPSLRIVKDLINVFFIELGWYVSILERSYFDRIHASWLEVSEDVVKTRNLDTLSRDLQYFPALLFQLLAVALHFLPPDSPSWRLLDLMDPLACEILSTKYSEIGMVIMSILGRHNPTLTAIQHDLMRATWLKNTSRGTESWHSLGDAIRQAQELGLHQHCELHHTKEASVESKLESIWYDEYKKRLWVNLFNWDSHMALILGRPRMINVGDCTVTAPLDCDLPEEPSKTVPTTNRHSKPTPFSTRLCQYTLSHKIHHMLSIGASKPHFKDYSAVTRLHDEIISLKNALPPAVRPEEPDTSWDSQYPNLPRQRLQLSSSMESFLIALHRPHITDHAASRRAGMQAALRVLETQRLLFNMVRGQHYKCFGFSFYTIDAAIFLCAAMIMCPPANRDLQQEILSSLRQAISRLTLTKTRNAMASSGEQVLKRCYEKIQKIPFLNIDTPDTQIDMQQLETPSQTIDEQPFSAALQSDIALASTSSYAQDFLGVFDMNEILTPQSESAYLNSFPIETDFDEAFWLDQMSQIVGMDLTAPGNDR
jgi:hypothetical protein